MIKKIILMTFFIYIIGHILAVQAMKTCSGWECDVVECKNGYAVLIPGKGYLPCEKFDEYIETNNKELLR